MSSGGSAGLLSSRFGVGEEEPAWTRQVNEPRTSATTTELSAALTSRSEENPAQPVVHPSSLSVRVDDEERSASQSRSAADAMVTKSPAPADLICSAQRPKFVPPTHAMPNCRSPSRWRSVMPERAVCGGGGGGELP